MRKKLEKFLIENGFTIKYINLITRQNYGGRSFDNDGTYKEEIYKISKDTATYYICDKCTGRPMFTLEDASNNIVFLDFSQKSFISQLQKKFQ